VGGVPSPTDLLQYVLAGATLVGIGTAAMQDPRRPERILRDLDRWIADHGVSRLSDLTGTLEWPSS
jgi:dihydroorotate dehydrogenase (NAD+) catalytic subunit